MDDELDRLREERDRFRALWLRAADERDALSEKLTEMDGQLERAHDRESLAWEHGEFWQGCAEAAEAALEEERGERDALIRLEVDRLTGREPKRRGRPPSWLPDSEAELECMQRTGTSIRQICAELHMSKSQVHRVIVRVRQRQAEAAERARLVAIADGRSPTQRSARAAKRAAERHPIEKYDPDRAERAREYLRNHAGADEAG
jgi:hypothetical protein